MLYFEQAEPYSDMISVGNICSHAIYSSCTYTAAKKMLDFVRGS